MHKLAIFSSIHWSLKVNSVHFSEHESPTILQAVVYVRPCSAFTTESCSATSTKAIPARVPLFHLASVLETSPTCNSAHADYDETGAMYSVQNNSSAGAIKHVSAYGGVGRLLGMIYKNTTALERLAALHELQWDL